MSWIFILFLLPVIISAFPSVSFIAHQRRRTPIDSLSLSLATISLLPKRTRQRGLRLFEAETDDDVIMDIYSDDDESEKLLLLQEIQDLTNTFLQVQETIKTNSIIYQQSIDEYEGRLQQATQQLNTNELLLQSKADEWAKEVEKLRSQLQQQQFKLEESTILSQQLQQKSIQEEEEITRRISSLNDQILSLQNEASAYTTRVAQLNNDLATKVELYQKASNETLYWQHLYQDLQKQISSQDILSLPPVVQFMEQVKEDTRKQWEEGEKLQLLAAQDQALNQIEEYWVQKYNDMVEKSKRDFIQYRANSIREKDLEDKKNHEEMVKQQTIIQNMQQTIHRYEEERKSLRRLVSLGVKRVVASLARRNDGEVSMKNNYTDFHDEQNDGSTMVMMMSSTTANSNSSSSSSSSSSSRSVNNIKLNKFLPMGAWRVGGSRKRSNTDRSTPSTPTPTPDQTKQ